MIGIDNLDPYYDVRLKQARLAMLRDAPGFSFFQLDIAERAAMLDLVGRHRGIRRIVHLAAQAGVRHSLVDPYAYVRTNVMGQSGGAGSGAASRCAGTPGLCQLVLGLRRQHRAALRGNRPGRHPTIDLRRDQAGRRADEPRYGHLFGLPQTGLRFFTVYGPWGRPDMAYYGFAKAICAGEPITAYDGGSLKRDFTYIDDIVAGVLACLDRPPAGAVPVRVLNIGNHRSESVATLIALLEQALGRRAVILDAPRPLADVTETFAAIEAIGALAGFVPKTPLTVGIPRFAAWFCDWHGIPSAR